MKKYFISLLAFLIFAILGSNVQAESVNVDENRSSASQEKGQRPPRPSKGEEGEKGQRPPPPPRGENGQGEDGQRPPRPPRGESGEQSSDGQRPPRHSES